MLDAAERHARAIVATWAEGTYDGEAALDDDGFGRTDIRIRARCTVRAGAVTIDLTGSDAQATGFVNSSHANMQSAVTMAFAFLLDPDMARNEGAFRPLTVRARPGTIVWAEEGAPVTMCTSHCANEIIEAVIVALAPACPERAMGGWGRRLRIALAGRDPRNGRRFIWHMFQARPGGGGSVAGDGYSTIGEWHSAGGIKFGSLEVAESRFPLVFETHEFRPGSAGDGRFRGGLGADMRLRVETAEPALANTAGEGVVHGARGILGGQDGAPHDYTLLAPGAAPRKLRSKEVGIPVPPGSVFHVLSGGGGGWGNPAERDPEARARDADQGLAAVTFAIGIDVGGTFTDRGRADPGRHADRCQGGHHAARPVGRACWTGSRAPPTALGLSPAALLGQAVAHRPWHHGRDQRAAGGQGGPRRDADHRGPSRRDRDARGAEARPLQSAHDPATAAGGRASFGWGSSSACAPTGASKRRSIPPPWMPRSTCLRPSGSRRSRSASCTPGPTRRMSARRRRRFGRACPAPM